MSDESVEIEDMAQDDTVEIEDLTIKHETDAAILVETQYGEEVWIPLSQVSAIHRGSRCIEMTAWIARKKGLL